MDFEAYYRHLDIPDPTQHLRHVGHTVGGEPITDGQVATIEATMVRLLGLSEADRVLDLCCGNGLFTKRLSKRCHSVIGVDFSPPLLAVAQRDHSAENIRYVRANVLRLDEESSLETFGCNKVVMNFALQYFTLPQFEQLLSLLLRITPKGRVFAFTLAPDRRKKWLFYDTIPRRLRYLARLLGRREHIENWYGPVDVGGVCDKFGLVCQVEEEGTLLHPRPYRMNFRIHDGIERT